MKNFLNFNTNDRLDEIIFENRNKSYGAYVLRNEEGAILKKSLFIGVAFFVTLAAVPILLNFLKTDIKSPTIVQQPPVWVEPPVEREKDPEPSQVQPQPTKPVETFIAVVPTPAKNPPIETPAPTVSNYDDAKAGFEKIEGEKPVLKYEPPVTQPTVVPIKTAEKPAVNPNEVIEKVDVEAKFLGGINAFRQKVGQNFDTGSFEGSGEKMTANVTFIVEKDGSISNVKASGNDASFNKEAEKSVKSLKEKWQPAKLNGEIVRSYFKIPITIQFE